MDPVIAARYVEADDQPPGDLRIGEAVRHQVQDFEFPPGEEAGSRRRLSLPDFALVRFIFDNPEDFTGEIRLDTIGDSLTK